MQNANLMTEVEKIAAFDPKNSEYTIYRWFSGPQGVWYSQNRDTLDQARQAIMDGNFE